VTEVSLLHHFLLPSATLYYVLLPLPLSDPPLGVVTTTTTTTIIVVKVRLNRIPNQISRLH
jgi:hypothetical protein